MDDMPVLSPLPECNIWLIEADTPARKLRISREPTVESLEGSFTKMNTNEEDRNT